MSSKFKTEFIVDESRIEEHQIPTSPVKISDRATKSANKQRNEKQEKKTPTVSNPAKQAATKLQAAAKDNAAQHSKGGAELHQVPKTVITPILQQTISQGSPSVKERTSNGTITIHNNEALTDRVSSARSKTHSVSSTSGAKCSDDRPNTLEGSSAISTPSTNPQSELNLGTPLSDVVHNEKPSPACENVRSEKEKGAKQVTATRKFTPTRIGSRQGTKKDSLSASKTSAQKITKTPTSISRPTNIAQSSPNTAKGFSSKQNPTKSAPMSGKTSAQSLHSKPTKASELVSNAAARRSKETILSAQYSKSSAQRSAVKAVSSFSKNNVTSDVYLHCPDAGISKDKQHITSDITKTTDGVTETDTRNSKIVPVNSTSDDNDKIMNKQHEEATLQSIVAVNDVKSDVSMLTNDISTTKEDPILPDGTLHGGNTVATTDQIAHRMPSTQRWTPNKTEILSRSSYRKPSSITYQPLHLLMTSASAHDRDQRREVSDVQESGLEPSQVLSTPVKVNYSNPESSMSHTLSLSTDHNLCDL